MRLLEEALPNEPLLTPLLLDVFYPGTLSQRVETTTIKVCVSACVCVFHFNPPGQLIVAFKICYLDETIPDNCITAGTLQWTSFYESDNTV